MSSRSFLQHCVLSLLPPSIPASSFPFTSNLFLLFYFVPSLSPFSSLLHRCLTSCPFLSFHRHLLLAPPFSLQYVCICASSFLTVSVCIKMPTTLHARSAVRLFHARKPTNSIPRDFAAAKRPTICMIIAAWSSLDRQPCRSRYATDNVSTTCSRLDRRTPSHGGTRWTVRAPARAVLTLRGFDAFVDSRLHGTDEYQERYTELFVKAPPELLSFQFRGRRFVSCIVNVEHRIRDSETFVFSTRAICRVAFGRKEIKQRDATRTACSISILTSAACLP